MSRTKSSRPLLQIVDGNAKTDVSNRREPGMFCGEAEQPQTFISETSYVKVLFHTDNFTDQVRCNPATRQPGSPASRTLSFLSSSSHIRSRWDFSFLRSSQERIPITAGATKTGILEALPSVVLCRQSLATYTNKQKSPCTGSLHISRALDIYLHGEKVCCESRMGLGT